MSKTEATRLTAKVGAKALRNADKYFTGDMGPIAIEILQNARRAGATRVDVTVTDAGGVTFKDDGRGLAREDAGVLLTFGGSANSADVEFREDPAGMGFFCLAGRRVEVASRDWTMVIPPRAMTGDEDALLSSSASPIDGLSVSFDAKTTKAEAVAKIADSAKHMPMAVAINGEPVRHVPFSTYLGDQVDGRSVLTRKAHGCEISVIRWESGGDAPSISREYGTDMAIDMFGQVFVVNVEKSDGEGYLPGLRSPLGAHPLEGGIPNPFHKGYGDGSKKPQWRIAITIGEASVLAPRLPARDAIVINDGWRAIAAEIESMVVELAASLPYNGIGKESPIRSLARKFGKAIGPNRVLVSTASYETNYGEFDDPVTLQAPVELRDGPTVVWRSPDSIDPSQCMIWANADASGADVAMAFALRANRDEAFRFIAPFGTPEDHAAAGYVECDRLSVKVTTKYGATHVAKTDLEEGSFSTFQLDLQDVLDLAGDDLEALVTTSITLTASSSADASRKVALAMDALAWVPADEYCDQARFFANEGTPVYVVTDMLMHAYQWYASGDSDNDSYETQKERALSDFTEFVEPHLIGKSDACVNALEAALAGVLRMGTFEGVLKQVTIKPIASQDGDGRASHRLTVTTSDGKRHTRVLR